MKQFTNFILMLLLATLSLNAQDSTTENVDQGWYNTISEKIKLEEYNITYSESHSAYQSPNRKNNIRFIYHPNGFTAIPRQIKIPLFDINDKRLSEDDKKYDELENWEAKFATLGYGRGDNIENVFEGKKIIVEDNKAYIEDSNMRIEYINNEEGMRQNFIINKKAIGIGFLSVQINIETLKRVVIGADALVIRDSEKEYLKYSSIKVWDAAGKELRGWFKEKNVIESVRGKNNITSLALIVNDNDAE